MKKIAVALMLVCALGLFAACGEDQAGTGDTPKTADIPLTDGYRRITAEQAKQMMDAGGATMVDVRTQTEYEEKHIPGALLVPLDQLAETAGTALPDSSAVLLVYCRSGNRSKTASKQLAEMGYTNVYEFGGIINWPYETVTGSEAR